MKKKYEFGITLVELTVVIIIIAITALFASPFSTHLLARLEAKKVTSTLQTMVIQSKHQAYLHHYRIAICGSNDAVNCSNNSWQQYIIIFKDVTPNRVRDHHEVIIEVIPLKLKYGTLSWKGVAARNIAFQADTGLPRGSNGSFYYCSYYSPDLHRHLLLSNMGHLRIEKRLQC